MLTCLFWNVNGVAKSGNRPLLPSEVRYQRLSALIAAEAVQTVAHAPMDIVILAESPFDGKLPLSGMKVADTLLPPNAKTGCKLEIYFRTDTVTLTTLDNTGRATIQRVVHRPSGKLFLLVAAHLESPQRLRREEDRRDDVRELVARILSVEQQEQCQRTFVVADLNYDPYELSVYGANYFHAVSTKMLARQRQRTVNEKRWSFFYNPMWAHFGDKDGRTAGTYYKRTSDLDCPFWHIPDQLLLRPELLDYWQDDYLWVLTNVGGQSIIKRDGTPDKANFSDHLPLLFRLDV